MFCSILDVDQQFRQLLSEWPSFLGGWGAFTQAKLCKILGNFGLSDFLINDFAIHKLSLLHTLPALDGALDLRGENEKVTHPLTS